MNPEFHNHISNLKAYRGERDLLAQMLLHNPELLPDLVTIALNTGDKNHHKACWILELVCEEDITLLTPHLANFCNALPRFSNDSAIRPISKICWFATVYNQKNAGFLSKKQMEQLTEACFDWLIAPKGKVAAKAYSMRALYEIGKKEDWIYPELQRILGEDANKHTAAYTAAAKGILKQIKKSG